MPVHAATAEDRHSAEKRMYAAMEGVCRWMPPLDAERDDAVMAGEVRSMNGGMVYRGGTLLRY